MSCRGNEQIIKNDKNGCKGSWEHGSGVRGPPEARDWALGVQTLKKRKATYWRGLRILGNPEVRTALSSEKEADSD